MEYSSQLSPPLLFMYIILRNHFFFLLFWFYFLYLHISIRRLCFYWILISIVSLVYNECKCCLLFLWSSRPLVFCMNLEIIEMMSSVKHTPHSWGNGRRHRLYITKAKWRTMCVQNIPARVKYRNRLPQILSVVYRCAFACLSFWFSFGFWYFVSILDTSVCV